MERKEKDTNPILFELIFTQLKNSTPYFMLNCLFVVLQFGLLIAKMYTLVHPSNADRYTHYPNPFFAIYYYLHCTLCASGPVPGTHPVFQPFRADGDSVGLLLAATLGPGSGVY